MDDVLAVQVRQEAALAAARPLQYVHARRRLRVRMVITGGSPNRLPGLLGTGCSLMSLSSLHRPHFTERHHPLRAHSFHTLSLLARLLASLPLVCPNCGADMRIIAPIREPTAPPPIARARATGKPGRGGAQGRLSTGRGAAREGSAAADPGPPGPAHARSRPRRSRPRATPRLPAGRGPGGHWSPVRSGALHHLAPNSW